MKIYYDEEGDYLEIFVGDSRPSYGEDINDDVTLFKDQETDEARQNMESAKDDSNNEEVKENSSKQKSLKQKKSGKKKSENE